MGINIPRKRKINILTSRSKKGNVGLEIIILIVVLFCFSLIVRFMYPVFTDLKDVVDDEENVPDAAKARMNDIYDRYPPIFDWAFVFILGFMWIGSLITAFFIDSHPLFFVFTVIVLIVIFYVAADISNSHQEIVEDADLVGDYDSFPMTNWVMNHLLEIIIVISFTVAVALYMKVSVL